MDNYQKLALYEAKMKYYESKLTEMDGGKLMDTGASGFKAKTAAEALEKALKEMGITEKQLNKLIELHNDSKIAQKAHEQNMSINATEKLLSDGANATARAIGSGLKSTGSFFEGLGRGVTRKPSVPVKSIDNQDGGLYAHNSYNGLPAPLLKPLPRK